MAFDFDFRMRIRVPRPVVFERLLRIEHLSRWFCSWARIEPKVGGTFKFGGETCIVLPEAAAWSTTIEEGKPLRRFAFAWPLLGAPTRVAYELEDEGADSAVLRTVHESVPRPETTCGTIRDAWRTCLGNLKAIAEGRSDGVRPDHTPVTAKDLRLAVLIDAPAPRVFAALADPEQVDHWSTGGVPRGAARVDPRPGGAFELGLDLGPDRILEIDPDRRIVLRTPRDRGDLRATLALEPKASGTAVYLTSSGYAPEEEGDVLRDRGRWSDRLMCLRNFVEGGESGFLNAYADQMRVR